MWLDIGWRDTLSGYDSVVAEAITMISLMNKDVPEPSAGDHITLNGTQYTVVQIDARDEVIANLIVKSR